MDAEVTMACLRAYKMEGDEGAEVVQPPEGSTNVSPFSSCSSRRGGDTMQRTW